MKRLLIISRGDPHCYDNLNDVSVLSEIEAEIVVIAYNRHADYFRHIPNIVDCVPLSYSELLQLDIVRPIVARHHHGKPIAAIATMDEICVEIAAALRDDFKIPGLSGDVARGFRDKITMKQRLREKGIRVPEYTSSTDQDAVRELFNKASRTVVKPRRGEAGSNDVHILESFANFASWSRDLRGRFGPGDYDVEEYIEGLLYHINALVIDGVVSHTVCAPYFDSLANIDFKWGRNFLTCSLPMGDLHNRLVEHAQTVVSALGLQNGSIHLESFVTKEDDIVFCEIAARVGGSGIATMIELLTGWHLPKLALQIELGEPIIQDTRPASPLCTGIVGIRSDKSGFVESVPDPSLFHQPWIKDIKMIVSEGKFKAPSAHGGDFCARFIMTARNEREFYALYMEVKRIFDENFLLKQI